MAATAVSTPLFRARDHGEPVTVRGRDIEARGERWIEPFLQANMDVIRRIGARPEPVTYPELRLLLHPGSHIGAVPLVSPSTRKVVAGLLVEPRFSWSALGGVLGETGFSVEPSVGGGALVPGSAREVPPWIIAGPVLNRLAALLRHLQRRFVSCQDVRAAPRGTIAWTTWASNHVPTGRWGSFPCAFSDPIDDPGLKAAVRWTLGRLRESLAAQAESIPARLLLGRVQELLAEAGPGAARRPATTGVPPSLESEWLSRGVEAIQWVAEERGLGGARALDGLTWDLSVEAVWEAWVAAFSRRLGTRMGLVASPFGGARRAISWSGHIRSMASLVPDVALTDPAGGRMVWIDAKYKAHLSLLARHGWNALAEDVRAAHRADLHQALAYAAMEDSARVDSVLAYPQLDPAARPAIAVASMTSGRRRLRLILASLPFGFVSPDQRERTIASWLEALA